MLQQIGKPFLNWAGKAERHEIRVPTAPLFVHERHSTKAILDGIRHRKARGQTLDLFGDAGMDIRENLEAYEHKGPWQNRMILGDSLAVMNSVWFESRCHGWFVRAWRSSAPRLRPAGCCRWAPAAGDC